MGVLYQPQLRTLTFTGAPPCPTLQEKDPDLVEHNFELLRAMALPKALKYASMALWVFTWKFTYYSPNTYKDRSPKKGERG